MHGLVFYFQHLQHCLLIPDLPNSNEEASEPLVSSWQKPTDFGKGNSRF